jgi:chromate transporter
MSNQPSSPSNPLLEVAVTFLRLGFTAFGGPAAHIALFHDEFVKRRAWLTDQYFLDLLGATNLIPGPNSTEMAMHIGQVRAGWRGLIVGGACFILPAALLVGILAALYVTYGSTPAADWLLYGIKPVVLAVIAQAIYNLGGKAAKSAFYVALGIAVFALYLLGINELVLLFGGALLAMVVMNARRLWQNRVTLVVPPLPAFLLAQTATVVPFSLGELFLTFLKIGGLLYGSGYVLLAFLRTDFVERLGWLTDQQLLDAVAIGQFTPGPLFTTATFVGYVMGGSIGAVVATLGIFLPGFVFVALLHPLVPRIRQSTWLSALLDGVNMAAVGLMAAVTVEIARAALVDWVTVALTAIAAVLLIRYKVNSTWLIIGGGVVGVVYRLATG